MISRIRFERDKGESERVKVAGVQKNVKVSFWELNLTEGRGETKNKQLAGFENFSGAKLSFYLGLWSKLMWLFLDRCQSFIGYETPNLRLSWYYGNMLYFLPVFISKKSLSLLLNSPPWSLHSMGAVSLRCPIIVYSSYRLYRLYYIQFTLVIASNF